MDIVKIDGAVRADGLADGGKDDTVVRHLVELCRALEIATIGEMVETEQVAEALRALGVNFAQGYLYGRPEKEPRTRLAAPARRQGVMEGWG